MIIRARKPPKPAIIRKTTAQREADAAKIDPVSAETWAAAALATAKVRDTLAILRLSERYRDKARVISTRLAAATNLTPCAIDERARTKPAREWHFNEFVTATNVAHALRDIVLTDFGEPSRQFELFDASRHAAVEAVSAFLTLLDKYATLVKRERSMERLSGNRSLRRR